MALLVSPDGPAYIQKCFTKIVELTLLHAGLDKLRFQFG